MVPQSTLMQRPCRECRIKSTQRVHMQETALPCFGESATSTSAGSCGPPPWASFCVLVCNRQACCARHCNPSRTCHGSMEGRGGGEHGSWAVVKRLRQGARASDHQGPAASSIRRVSMRACSNPTQITSFSVYYHDITVTFLSREHNYICK